MISCDVTMSNVLQLTCKIPFIAPLPPPSPPTCLLSTLHLTPPTPQFALHTKVLYSSLSCPLFSTLLLPPLLFLRVRSHSSTPVMRTGGTGGTGTSTGTNSPARTTRTALTTTSSSGSGSGNNGIMGSGKQMRSIIKMQIN